MAGAARFSREPAGTDLPPLPSTSALKLGKGSTAFGYYLPTQATGART